MLHLFFTIIFIFILNQQFTKYKNHIKNSTFSLSKCVFNIYLYIFFLIFMLFFINPSGD